MVNKEFADAQIVTKVNSTIVYGILYGVHYSVCRTVHGKYFKVYCIYCTLYNIRLIMCSIWHVMHAVKCTTNIVWRCTALYAVISTPNDVHHTTYTDKTLTTHICIYYKCMCDARMCLFQLVIYVQVSIKYSYTIYIYIYIILMYMSTRAMYVVHTYSCVCICESV